MKVDTKFWVLNQKEGPIVLQRIVGSEAFLLNDQGWIGRSFLSDVTWYFDSHVVSKDLEPRPSQVTIPRISLLGDKHTVVEWIERNAGRLVGFAQGCRGGRSTVGTIHVVDLWMTVEDGIHKCDLALMYALADFDFSQLTPVSDYFEWTGITRSDGQPADPPPKSRYKRAWVI